MFYTENNNYRQELKFLCREHNLYLMENRIQHICKLDTHARSGGYSIRSLYFDSYDDSCYYENKAGVDHRRKYRIRVYNGSMDMIKLECKYSIRERKVKTSCQISKKQCQCLIQGAAIKDVNSSQELLKHFLIERKMELLVPKVIVEYDRMPYVYPAGDVRITFDRWISSSVDFFHFFEKSIVRRLILPQNIHIMEVKYSDGIPNAIKEVLGGDASLSRTSFSKYTLCREFSIK
ncbi:MAG: polyphosphate polymerase domain-containing protein [Eubacterium sp.]|nr:polyphosphate polymerase domain-containing protein [uncultured Schaedlerella sp.]MCI9127776.1 polyphosphate polymerase domain-containing protein [Eubacterium sp.]